MYIYPYLDIYTYTKHLVSVASARIEVQHRRVHVRGGGDGAGGGGSLGGGEHALTRCDIETFRARVQ